MEKKCREFLEGETVRWKRAHSTDPERRMTIITIVTLNGIEQAHCQYILTRGTIQNAFSGTSPIVEPIKKWFLFSELEHVSETA